MKNRFDVIVVGSGMVGAACACLLSGTSLRVALIEARKPQPFIENGEYDLRVSAISRASERILTAAGAWDAISAARISPYTSMHVWDASGNGSVHFDSHELGEPNLGNIIENRLIIHSLLAVIDASPNIEFICPAIPNELVFADEKVTVSLESWETMESRIVIAADGSDSRLRGLAGIQARSLDYDQQAVVAHVSPSESHQDTAWQRFLETGPLALLPLVDGRVSIVWSTTPKRAQELLAMDDQAFCTALSEASEHRLGEIQATSARATFSLRRAHAEHYIAPRFALVGDAAHTVHPLAGQGVNLGLLDAAAIVETLLAAVRAGRDIGDTRQLRRYERWRRGHNQLMIHALDGFKQLFGIRTPPFGLLRSLGLNLLDRTKPLKNQMARHAMGLSGDLPQAARSGIKTLT
ncbi:MAG: UbiH/UbiF/VisC/COQ6 family ubiquinone biosynthesis hydroxylase [Gammaproteobacteria bacterium]